MTHLTPNLVAVQVPEEAQDAYIDYGFLIYNLGEDPPYEYSEPLVGHYRFLGLCTSSGPEFDAEGYVERHPNGLWLNYEQTDPLASDGFVDTSDSSFLSLMQSAGCYFENPLGSEAPKYDVSKDDGSASRYLDWTAAQSQSSPKWAILEKLLPPPPETIGETEG